METLRNYGINPSHPGAIALKGLLDNGININDARCQTLISLLSNHDRQKQLSPNRPSPSPSPPSNQLQRPTMNSVNSNNNIGNYNLNHHQNNLSPNNDNQQRAMQHQHQPQQQHTMQYTLHHNHPRVNNTPSQPSAVPRMPTLGYQGNNAQQFDARHSSYTHQPSNVSRATQNSLVNRTPRASRVNRLTTPHQQAQNLFSGAHPWSGTGTANPGVSQHGVPYFLPTSASQQLRYPMQQPCNVYSSGSNHLVQQPSLNHVPNRPFSFQDNQRAIIQRRLLIEREAAQKFVTPTSAAVQKVEVRPQPPTAPEITQPMLDPAKYFTDTYSSPADQTRSSPGNTPKSSDRFVPASGARPPPMPPLKSIVGSTPPKRKRTPKSSPSSEGTQQNRFSEAETEQVLDGGLVQNLFPSQEKSQPPNASSAFPLRSKPDPKVQQADQPPPKPKSEKSSKKKKRRSKKARKTGEDTRMAGDGTKKQTSDGPNHNIEANGNSNSSNTDPSEDFDVSKATNVFQIPKKLKPKKKRKRKQKAEVANGTVQETQGDMTDKTDTTGATPEMRVNGVKINQVFQAKAQTDAFRRIARNTEPPLEVTLASGGVQSLSKLSKNGVVIPSDLLSQGKYQEESARSILKPAIGTQPSPFEKRPSLSAKPTQVAKPNGSSESSTTGPKNITATTEHPINALFDAPPISRAAKAQARKAKSNANKEEALNRMEEALKTPTPFPPLRHLRNEKLYMYRREVLENFSRSRAHLNLNRRPVPKPAKPGNPATTAPANGTVAVDVANPALPNGVLFPQINSTPIQQSLGVANPSIAKHRYCEAPITVAPSQYNGRQFRELLLERESRINSRIQNHLNELNSLPSDVHEDFRRIVIMEKKKLNLIKLQRAARADITATMRALFARGNTLPIGDENLTKYRYPTPSNWYWRHPRTAGVNLANPNGTLSEVALRNMKSMNDQHRRVQENRRAVRQKATMNKLLVHAGTVHEFKMKRAIQHKKLLKDLDRYFRDKAKEEERRKRKEQQDRLKALRENNEDEYMKLLKNTKNKRLLQLLKQTDEYLTTIGAKVAQAQQAGRDDDARASKKKKSKSKDGDADEVEKDNDEQRKDNDADLSAIQQRRNNYYTVTHSVQEKVRQPTTLIGGTLKHYQLEGLEWLVSLYNNNLNGILADEMGLGKTIQTLSLITYLVEVKDVSGPYLIIVPLSTISNWVRELKHWAPSLSHIVYRGDPNTRKNIYQRQIVGGDFNVLLTTYEFVVKDTKNLSKVKWKYIIIDEGHRMKNAECKLALTLGSKYKSRNRILLTGTPLQNNLTELWALLNFLLPTIFSNSETFEQWFNAPFQAACLGGGADLDEEENLLVISRLHQVLRPFMLRRLKTDVECQLPDKVEEVLKCKMSAWQRIMYRQMQDRLGIASNSSKSTKAFNNIVMQLKKVANHPYLFYGDEELHRLPRDYLIRTSGKFELLHHVLQKMQRTGHRVLMFSQMTSALDFLETFMYNNGINYLRLDGTTKADDRQKMLEDFNAPDSKYFCFLLSTRAGGLGLNLQTADTVIIFDSDWNPMMDLQAQDRAHRIGQTKEVRVLRLICAGTIEEQILERANQKLRMDAQVIQAGQFNNKSSDRDRQEMLKHILRKPTGNEEDEKNQDATTLEELNRMLARCDEEFELYTQMDMERLAVAKETGRPPLMEDEAEVPEWVRIPEVEKKSKEQLEAEYMREHGRGQRKRKQVRYSDALTEQEFTEVVEQDGDLEEAARRKRRKITVPEEEEERIKVDERLPSGDEGIPSGNEHIPSVDGKIEQSVRRSESEEDEEKEKQQQTGKRKKRNRHRPGKKNNNNRNNN